MSSDRVNDLKLVEKRKQNLRNYMNYGINIQLTQGLEQK